MAGVAQTFSAKGVEDSLIRAQYEGPQQPYRLRKMPKKK
jgi:hypothetical protein